MLFLFFSFVFWKGLKKKMKRKKLALCWGCVGVVLYDQTHLWGYAEKERRERIREKEMMIGEVLNLILDC